VDENGMITRCNLIVSTTNNNEAMNAAVRWVANNVIDRKGTVTDGMLNQVEVAIRAYDPCLSCATHAMGKMPLKIELYNHLGELSYERTKN
jgi:NAD-reducing hydrogenase large subunit